MGETKLKPGGWLAILRNYWADAELSAALEAVFPAADGLDTSALMKGRRKPRSFYYGDQDFLKQTFPFIIQSTWEEFIGSLSTASYAPDEGSPLYANFERSAKRVFDSFSAGGLLDSQIVTELYLGKVIL